MLGSPVSQTVSQNPNGFSTSVLLSLSQASPGIQQSATYSNPYPFSTTNFKAVQQPVLQQIANNQHPTLSLPHEATTISHLQLTQQHQLNIQQQQQDSFQTESSRPLPPQLMVSSNGTVGFQRQFPDLSHYLPQNGGVSAPSVSLASILAGSRSNSVNPTVPKVEAPILTSGKLTSSGTKNGRKVWTGTRNKAGIQTISGNSIDEPLSVQTVFIDQEGIAFKNTPKPLSFLSASSEQHSTSYKVDSTTFRYRTTFSFGIIDVGIKKWFQSNFLHPKAYRQLHVESPRETKELVRMSCQIFPRPLQLHQTLASDIRFPSRLLFKLNMETIQTLLLL